MQWSDGAYSVYCGYFVEQVEKVTGICLENFDFNDTIDLPKYNGHKKFCQSIGHGDRQANLVSCSYI